jgi:LPXTG-motif cell wall-anchored protein
MARIRAYLVTVIIFAVAVHLVWDAVSPTLPYVIGGLVALAALGLVYYRRRL